MRCLRLTRADHSLSSKIQRVGARRDCSLARLIPVGRLSVGEAGFLTHLLDTGISEQPIAKHRPSSPSVSLSGHVIDCPQSLTTGATILLNVRVYLTRQAFHKVEKEGREENGTFWQEQKETGEEEAMRRRKDALGALFSGFQYRSPDPAHVQVESVSSPCCRMRSSWLRRRMAKRPRSTR